MVCLRNVTALIGRKDAMVLLDEANKIDDQFTKLKDVTVEVSKKLKRAAGKVCYTYSDNRYVIKLSYDYYKTFGIERSLKTLRHEFAHIIDFMKNNKMSHSHYFKTICDKLGGSMNSKMAGTTFSASATNQYIKPIKSYMYTCTCGFSVKRIKRMSEKIRTSHSHYCPKCRTKVAFFTETKIIL